MFAVVLAGGKGTRLKPYTVTLPKPLVPVGDEPILKLLIEKNRSEGIHEIVICINHMGDLIQAYFGDGSEYGIKIRYSGEKKQLGTVAPIKLIDDLPENFLIMNGDILTDLSFNELMTEHLNNDSIMTVATYHKRIHVEYGVVNSDESQHIKEFVEKPDLFVNVCMGVYAVNKRILDFIPENTFFGFDDLVKAILPTQESIKNFEHHGYWLDIGKPDEYEKANEDYLKFKSNFSD